MDLFPEIQFMRLWAEYMIAKVRADDRGMTTETVIITAVLALAAVGAAKLIYDKITAKANTISTE